MKIDERYSVVSVKGYLKYFSTPVNIIVSKLTKRDLADVVCIQQVISVLNRDVNQILILFRFPWHYLLRHENYKPRWFKILWGFSKVIL